MARSLHHFLLDGPHDVSLRVEFRIAVLRQGRLERHYRAAVAVPEERLSPGHVGEKARALESVVAIVHKDGIVVVYAVQGGGHAQRRPWSTSSRTTTDASG